MSGVNSGREEAITEGKENVSGWNLQECVSYLWSQADSNSTLRPLVRERAVNLLVRQVKSNNTISISAVKQRSQKEEELAANLMKATELINLQLHLLGQGHLRKGILPIRFGNQKDLEELDEKMRTLAAESERLKCLL